MKKKIYFTEAYLRFILLFWLMSPLLYGCKKLVEVDLPADKYTNKVVYGSKATAVLALTGLYASLRELAVPYNITINSAYLADEVGSLSSFNQFGLNDVPADEAFFWVNTYQRMIYGTNTVIENVNISDKLDEATKKIIIAEAKFIRAYCYFYLVNYYGDVPLVLTTDYTKNTNIARSPKAEVYAQIVKDLTDAQVDLKDNYLSTDLVSVSNERLRPNKGAATALLARTYLYMEKWPQAELESTKVIEDSRCELLNDLNQVFLINSREALWQLQPKFGENGSSNTLEGQTLIPDASGFPACPLSSFLQHDFEPGDLRNVNWVSTVTYDGIEYKIPYKYKVGATLGGKQDQTEATMMLRLAEQYLIRAEARAQQGKLTGANSAESDLNMIRHRAGLSNTTATGQREMLDAILKERRIEFFIESGHRWMDLKRTGKIDAVMTIVTPAKGGTWSPFKALMPIPKSEFQTNAALNGHQNPGYPER